MNQFDRMCEVMSSDYICRHALWGPYLLTIIRWVSPLVSLSLSFTLY
uniref:Uncharacterized protein n=1 Tax=Anguilla anguilla TaxID=7936 RepID=A0A0E9QII4_ANGAN